MFFIVASMLTCVVPSKILNIRENWIPLRLSFWLVNRIATGRPFCFVTSAVYEPLSKTGSGGPNHSWSLPQP